MKRRLVEFVRNQEPVDSMELLMNLAEAVWAGEKVKFPVDGKVVNRITVHHVRMQLTRKGRTDIELAMVTQRHVLVSVKPDSISASRPKRKPRTIKRSLRKRSVR